MRNKICGIYKIENLVNHKIYIGQSVDIKGSRWPSHLYMLRNGIHYNQYLQNSWNKYGEENFDFSIIEECEAESLDEKEMYYISLYKSYLNEFGYNCNLGGQGTGGHVPNNETRKKMSESHIGILGTEESKKKQSAALKGANNYNYGRYGELHPTYGKHSSDEIRNKIKASWTEERKQKQSKMMSGDLNPMFKRCGVLNPAARSVVCLNTMEVFETLKDAAMWCGLKDPYYVTLACKDKKKYAGKHPITKEKLNWAYFEDYDKNTTNQ